MPPADPDLFFRQTEKVRCILFFVNRRSRFDCAAEYDRHAIADAAVDAAVMVRVCDDLFALYGETVVSGAPSHVCQRKSAAELHAFDGRDAEQSM